MRIANIFTSISGEISGFPQGQICTFVRTAKCNLRCSYCDTPETQTGKDFQSIAVEDVVALVEAEKTRKIIITGGEPLLQKDFLYLLNQLITKGYKIGIETNGTIIPGCGFGLHKENVTWIIDYKLEYEERMIHFSHPLPENTIVKFVICNEKELERAISVHKRLLMLKARSVFAYSVDHGRFPPQTIYKELLDKGLRNSVINVQLHKILGFE